MTSKAVARLKALGWLVMAGALLVSAPMMALFFWLADVGHRQRALMDVVGWASAIVLTVGSMFALMVWVSTPPGLRYRPWLLVAWLVGAGSETVMVATARVTLLIPGGTLVEAVGSAGKFVTEWLIAGFTALAPTAMAAAGAMAVAVLEGWQEELEAAETEARVDLAMAELEASSEAREASSEAGESPEASLEVREVTPAALSLSPGERGPGGEGASLPPSASRLHCEWCGRTWYRPPAQAARSLAGHRGNCPRKPEAVADA